MASAEAVVVQAGPFMCPHSYELGPNETWRPIALFLNYLGIPADAPYILCCTIRDSSGNVLSRTFTDTIAVTDDGGVTFSPFGPPESVGLRYNVLNADPGFLSSHTGGETELVAAGEFHEQGVLVVIDVPSNKTRLRMEDNGHMILSGGGTPGTGPSLEMTSAGFVQLVGKVGQSGSIIMDHLVLSSNLPPDIGFPNQNTVGAAGGAAALPATPRGYFRVHGPGVDVLIPFYNV